MRFRIFDGLKLFCTVAEKMSFTAAGETLHMSKGVVSYQIAKLEDELGFQLFERFPARFPADCVLAPQRSIRQGLVAVRGRDLFDPEPVKFRSWCKFDRNLSGKPVKELQRFGIAGRGVPSGLELPQLFDQRRGTIG